MDPNLFHIDYNRLFEVLITIVVFSFLIERALSIVFESRFFIDRIDAKPPQPEVRDDAGRLVSEATPGREKKKGVKEVIALVVCVLFCYFWKFDALTIILVSYDKMTVGGMIITGAVIAGGSKASIGLFRDVMGFMSSAEKERQVQLKQTRDKK